MSAELRSKPVQVIEPTIGIRLWISDLWLFRSVLVALCIRDVRGKYKQASLGVAWAVIQPLVQVGVFTLIFRGVAGVETSVPYPVYVLAALLPFNLFQQVLTLGTPAFVAAQGIVTKVYFPRSYTILASCSSAVINAGITLGLLILAMGWFGVGVSPRIVLAIPILVGVLLLSIGVASLLSAVNARFRDVQHALPLMMTVLLYASPVLYPLERVPASIRPFIYLNPITGLVDGFRSAVVGTSPHSWPVTFAALVVSVGVFLGGVWFFERSQSKLIDIL